MSTDESIVYQAHLHWIMFVPPFVVFLAVVAVGVWFDIAREASILLGSLVFIWAVLNYLTVRCCSLTVRKRGLVWRSGLLSRNTLDIPLDKIESVNIHQTLFGALLGYGTIEITGTGGSHEYMTNLSQPLTCRRFIEQVMHHD